MQLPSTTGRCLLLVVLLTSYPLACAPSTRPLEPQPGVDGDAMPLREAGNAKFSGRVEAIACRPGKSEFAVGLEDGQIVIWDAAANREIATFSTAGKNASSLAFSPDGTFLACGTGGWGTADVPASNGHVYLWHVDQRRLLHTEKVHAKMVASLAFSPKSDLLASSSWDDTISVRDVATMKELWRLSKFAANSIAFAKGRRLVSSGVPISIWDLPEKNDMAATPAREFGGGQPIATDPDGELVFAGQAGDIHDGRSTSFWIWRLDSGQRVGSLSPPGNHPMGLIEGFKGAAVCPNGKWLVSLDHRTIRLWNLTTRRQAAAITTSNAVEQVAVSDDGRHVFVSAPFARRVSWYQVKEDVEVRE